ncbi:MAG: hypothetical protein U1D30_09470 [Planctomycetota bacterium]
MIPPIDAHHISMIHHVVGPRPTRRGFVTHEPVDLENHLRYTSSESATTPSTTNTDSHVNYRSADLQALQYSQALEQIQVGVAAGQTPQEVLDGVNEIGSSLSAPLQISADQYYSESQSTHTGTVIAKDLPATVVHTYLHDEAAIRTAKESTQPHELDITT